MLCFGCGSKIKENHLCLECQSQIEILTPPYCYKKSKVKIISACVYKSPLKDMIHHFKYNHCAYLAEPLSRLMIKQLRTLGFNPLRYDFITCVPLHPYKLKVRGYNQAELLAQQIANYFKLPLKNGIIASKYIKNPQAKLTSKKRKENVEGKFKAKGNLKNKNIILVDDVFTTGATIHNCWKALKEKGANKIQAITLAR